ncbi:uncharacterized protein ASPGLDRAFT_991992 [Aspergillus glaucus CBS 516.65]|uniref:EthD domain-containing protein n=1 Tax=Aspergillus glaucus CBS 516.65 TaxID=1160497 RepID=A0A1L9VV46_ASPGL|nr:hypothetical protein ASPGLDRAFT_991992 [Aspergillus glaucus CBS 516.65]OJJ87770.1 hypothetical protein ASPGLDRAFT_991992 [Aspergillus glaucus CBS 516.65]
MHSGQMKDYTLRLYYGSPEIYQKYDDNIASLVKTKYGEAGAINFIEPPDYEDQTHFFVFEAPIDASDKVHAVKLEDDIIVVLETLLPDE